MVPLIPALGRLGGRGKQISEFESSLVYRVSSRTARAEQRTLSRKNKNKKKKKKKKRKKKKKKENKKLPVLPEHVGSLTTTAGIQCVLLAFMSTTYTWGTDVCKTFMSMRRKSASL